jgi:alginate O-acetyltransferase complex protein AlgI
MLFNSIKFFIFFPLVTALYYILPHRFRWFLLLAASCYFYMTFIPIYILILIITILIDYFAGILIEKASDKNKKLLLVISIISTCMVLFIFKYFNFFTSNFNSIAQLIHWNYSIETLNLILPIGLSFHTFQSLSYVIEVYRGNQKAERNFGIYSLYVMYYPQLVAGPIERPQNLLHQLHEEHFFNSKKFIEGLKLMIWGFFLKLVVADRAAIYVNAVFNNIPQHDGLTFSAATVLFSFQIYGDFAGYSLIAIGASRTMGIELMQNFNRPYFAYSIREFWRRWHISLSTWFRDYVFFPVLTTISSKLKSEKVFYIKSDLFLYIVASSVTWLLTGLWHGANWTFVIWGSLHGIFLIIDVIVNKKKKRNIFNIFLTFVMVNFAWIFFRARTVTGAFTVIKDIFTKPGKLFMPPGDDIVAPVYAIIAILILLIVEIKKEFFNNLFSFSQNKYESVRLLYYTILLFIILYLGVFDGGQFIYFQF